MDPGFKLINKEGYVKPPIGLGTNIVNLSNYILNSSEQKLLSKGLNFVPTPKTTNLEDIQNSVSEFIRSVKVQYAASNLKFNSSKLPFTGKSKWQPSPALLDPDLLDNLKDIKSRADSLDKTKENSNLTNSEYLAFKNLKQQTNLVFKPADKGDKSS